MPKHYTAADKSSAIAKLIANGGNIAHTSRELDIPERTLRHWRRDYMHKNAADSLPLPPHPPQLGRQNPLLDSGLSDIEILVAVRQQMITHIANVVPTLTDGLDLIAPYHRILAFSQLFDHLERLDAFIAHLRTEDNPHLKQILDALEFNIGIIAKMQLLKMQGDEKGNDYSGNSGTGKNTHAPGAS